MSIAVVGLGYVGLPLALLASTRGYRVRGYDIDKRKIDGIRAKSISYLSEEESRVLAGLHELEVSNEEEILAGADTYIICVPTPVNDQHEPDLAPLESACATVGKYLSKGSLVVVESTINPGVCESSAIPLLERESGLKAEEDFFFAHCPERVNPGDKNWDVRNIPRVLGAIGPKSFLRAYALYASLIDGAIHPLRTIKEAEAVKMVENAFRDVNIAFVNELAMSFGKAGIDITNVLRGAATKPFGYMPHTPGCGVGGHCIPVDPYYLIRYGRENGFEHDFLATARRINNGMPEYTVDVLKDALKEKKQTLKGAKVTLLGLAYKKDIPDMRESPAVEIRKILEEHGALVTAFDPYVLDESDATSSEEALTGADAVLLATDHSEFLGLLSPSYLATLGIDIVIDGRNVLSREQYEGTGITYKGIGR